MNKIKLKNRFASIWFPQLPLETILSKEPLLDSLPLVVSFSEGEEIICANELAKNYSDEWMREVALHNMRIFWNIDNHRNYVIKHFFEQLFDDHSTESQQKLYTSLI